MFPWERKLKRRFFLEILFAINSKRNACFLKKMDTLLARESSQKESLVQRLAGDLRLRGDLYWNFFVLTAVGMIASYTRPYAFLENYLASYLKVYDPELRLSNIHWWPVFSQIGIFCGTILYPTFCKLLSLKKGMAFFVLLEAVHFLIFALFISFPLLNFA